MSTCTIDTVVIQGVTMICIIGCTASNTRSNIVLKYSEDPVRTDTGPTYGCWVGLLGTTRCGCRYTSEPVKAAGRIHRPDHVMYRDISRVGQGLLWRGAAHHGRPHGYSGTPKLKVATPEFSGTLSAWGMGCDLVHSGVALNALHVKRNCDSGVSVELLVNSKLSRCNTIW
jgi:hypothetical protein